ncbi:hypothetical protein CC80DRAFT_541792 [Byssothecium circinans]|uniref:Uncharacterized protein n=1 Tax=Byssothecium circinans TaxID=147558 RepID=A0A6A5UFC8_9PLEO|nr:hypothetical protein CC80DRAFT_541792 [Byssothecium circinans]
MGTKRKRASKPATGRRCQKREHSTTSGRKYDDNYPSAQPRTSDTTDRKSFVDLPAELHNRIFEPELLRPKVTIANKQIREETTSMFFIKNTFDFQLRWEHFNFAPQAFISDISSSFKLLRSLHLSLELPFPGYNRGLLAQVPANIRTLLKSLRTLNLLHYGMTVYGSPASTLLRGRKAWDCGWFDSFPNSGPFESVTFDVRGIVLSLGQISIQETLAPAAKIFKMRNVLGVPDLRGTSVYVVAVRGPLPGQGS